MQEMAQVRENLSESEFLIVSEIAENDAVNQRALSKKLGVSLGTINTLINKMIREGLIKIEQVSSRQVAYMLTPVGFMEKAKKTVSYLKSHYRAIYETKEKLKQIIDDLARRYDLVYIIKTEDEIGEIVNVAISEHYSNLSGIQINTINSCELIVKKSSNGKFGVINVTEQNVAELLAEYDCEVVNLIREL